MPCQVLTLISACHATCMPCHVHAVPMHMPCRAHALQGTCPAKCMPCQAHALPGAGCMLDKCMPCHVHGMPCQMHALPSACLPSAYPAKFMPCHLHAVPSACLARYMTYHVHPLPAACPGCQQHGMLGACLALPTACPNLYKYTPCRLHAFTTTCLDSYMPCQVHALPGACMPCQVHALPHACHAMLATSQSYMPCQLHALVVACGQGHGYLYLCPSSAKGTYVSCYLSIILHDSPSPKLPYTKSGHKLQGCASCDEVR